MAVYPGAVAAHTTGKKCCWEALGGNSALEPGWLFSQPFVVAQVLCVCIYGYIWKQYINVNHISDLTPKKTFVNRQ